ncbi:MAG: hypothetical protein AMXMBFR82_26070 [Candidatus Hydrogenedentota bacterium]
MCGALRSMMLAVAAVLALGAGPAMAQEEKAVEFKAGAAVSNISPWMGLSLAGHMQDRVVDNVHDQLHVRSLVLDDGTTRLAFAVVDSCMVPKEIIDAAKKTIEESTGLPASHILVSATHTHTAPCSTPVFQTDPSEDYQRFLTARIVDAVQCAINNLAPARIGFGQGSLPDEVFNRRWRMKPGTIGPDPFGNDDELVKMNPPRASEDLIEPAGPIDPSIPFLAVETADGEPLALLANYSLHYIGGTGGGDASADYFGMFADRIQELLKADRRDPAFVGIMTNGTSGDINNINFRVPAEAQQPFEQMRKVANKVAAEVFQAYQDVQFQDWVQLSAAQEQIELGVRKPDEAELVRAKEIIAQAEGPEMKTMPEIYARESVLIAEYPDTVPVLLQAFRIGDVLISAVPCEVFVEIGLHLKEQSPLDKSFTIELANGYNGYLPTTEQHSWGGYETWRARSSYLEVEADQKIAETVLNLYGQVTAGMEQGG